jgi:hypothetical protein
MGSSGSKPRKKKNSQHKGSQHLPKVGTATENERLLHEEQHAVAAQMGLGNLGSGSRNIALIIIGAIVAIAIVSLLVLITFH